MNRAFLSGILGLLVLAAGNGAAAGTTVEIDEAAFRRHVQTLASDEFEGRKPATPGGEKTIAYLRDQFAALGLEPGNRGSWFQKVPLVEITAEPGATLVFERGDTRAELAQGDDMVVWTKRVVATSALERSDLVFVGYGIVAPEYGWNDYAAADIRGKTAVILINDPGFVTGDPKLFAGRAMTYHGRWTYKFEEAARQGAAGALIIHDTEPAAYGWEVVQTSWTGPQLDKQTADDGAGRVAIEGWITGPKAAELFAMAGKDLDALEKAATRADFRAVPLGVQASVRLRNSIRRSESANVIAIQRGTKRPDDFVVYTAHWDHLGKAGEGSGDAIFNGAIDNATGSAALLALAQAFRSTKPAPERSIVFLAVTAEESGLLGSAYYADNPVFPLARTAAVINMDALMDGGPTREISVIGYGSSELEGYLQKAAAAQQRVIKAEPHPERGYFYRSDHFNFAKKGVPALYAKLGVDAREGGVAVGEQNLEDYTEKRYHQPADEYRPDLDFRGTLQDLALFYAVGLRVSREEGWPNWNPGNEFRAPRDASSATRK